MGGLLAGASELHSGSPPLFWDVETRNWGIGNGDRSDWKDVENLGDWFEAPFGGRGAGGAGDFGEIRRNS